MGVLLGRMGAVFSVSDYDLLHLASSGRWSWFDGTVAFMVALAATVMAQFFYLVLRRDKVGWIMSNLLFLNIVFWIVNFL